MSLSAIQQEHKRRPLHICITGSSQGIGLAAAKILVAEGHVVYHACRTPDRAAAAVQAAGGGIPLVCDLSDAYSIQRFSRMLMIRAPHLDVLCLNAGISPSASPNNTKPARLTEQGWEACVGVNHLGHFLLAKLLYPKLLAEGGGRIVITSSSVHDPDTKAGRSGTGGQGASLGDLSGLGVNLAKHPNGATMTDGSLEYNGAKVYKDSKLCNILFGKQAAHKFPLVWTISFNPGLVPSTGLFQSLRDENWMKATILTWMAWATGYSIPVHVAGRRLAYLAASPEPLSLLKSGSYVSAPVKSRAMTLSDGFVESKVSKDGSDPALAKRLWEKSIEVVHDWL